MPRLSFDVTREVDDFLSSVAHDNGISKAEAVRRALALLSVAEEEKRKPGMSIGVVREDENHDLHAVCRIVGV